MGGAAVSQRRAAGGEPGHRQTRQGESRSGSTASGRHLPTGQPGGDLEIRELGRCGLGGCSRDWRGQE